MSNPYSCKSSWRGNQRLLPVSVVAGADLSLEGYPWLALGPCGLGGTGQPGLLPCPNPSSPGVFDSIRERCPRSAGLAELVICEGEVVINPVFLLLGGSLLNYSERRGEVRDCFLAYGPLD